MRTTTAIFRLAVLGTLAVGILSGCIKAPGEVRYVNKANSKETLTMKHTGGLKNVVIGGVHHVSSGDYTLTTEKGTTSGGFTVASTEFTFRPANGEKQTVKANSDGSFEFSHINWEPVSDAKVEKELAKVGA